MSYERALEELYQAPVEQFVAERKRLAAELKAAGDAAGAKVLLARKRPPVSAWVVNQLYWHARDAFEPLLASAKRLREGDLGATAAHREATAALRARAKAMLDDAGHATNEAVMRRVMQTLAALAATGGFEPDAPGTLAEDRDPPGFEALGALAAVAPAPSPVPAHAPVVAKAHRKGDDGAERAEREARERQERERREAEARAKEVARRERARLDAAIETARMVADARARDVEAREKELRAAQQAAKEARARVGQLERERAELGDD